MLEISRPDFRGRAQLALEILAETPPDVMNHNLETVPRLYRQARPGGDYAHSLDLLEQFKDCILPADEIRPDGRLGETDDEILAVMRDLRAHEVDMLTIGSTCGPRRIICRWSATLILQCSRNTKKQATAWVSSTPRSARWCARRTTPTGRPMRPGRLNPVLDGLFASAGAVVNTRTPDFLATLLNVCVRLDSRGGVGQ